MGVSGADRAAGRGGDPCNCVRAKMEGGLLERYRNPTRQPLGTDCIRKLAGGFWKNGQTCAQEVSKTAKRDPRRPQSAPRPP
eukprot:5521468-Pyramimonas_sp.AAC.1